MKSIACILCFYNEGDFGIAIKLFALMSVECVNGELVKRLLLSIYLCVSVE